MGSSAPRSVSGRTYPWICLWRWKEAAARERFDPHQVATRLGVELSNLNSLAYWSDRLARVKEHLSPHPDYRLGKFQPTKRRWLPLLYLRRIWEGIHKLWL